MAGKKKIAVKKYVVRLSSEEREQLGTLIRKGKGPAQRLLKARILLKADVSDAGPGWSDSKIIAALDTSASMVYRVRMQLVEEGLVAVLSRKQRAMPAVPRIFDGEKEASAVFSGEGGGRLVPRIFEPPRERLHDAPGRPSSLAHIRREAERRAVTGTAPKRLKTFASELSAWLRKTYPDLPQMKPRSLENKIRDIWGLRQKSI